MSLAPHPTDAPFWSARPDAPALERQHEERLARARAAIAGIESAAGPRTIDTTLVAYDTAVLEIDTVAAQASLLANTHPDPVLRATAARMSQQASALATELALNRSV